ncbi:unnamed protein product [Owenia fusiformis]|uniref:Helicase POLQ-like n=1 Tax=Owenia fusiformis TaxID=6347 RepID=A0A8S4PF64_OWEFU|nr:unnamed protein product [Owenia fusiformis]
MKPRLTPIHSLTPSGQASENKHSNTYNTKISHSHNVTELKRKSSENRTPITSRTLKSRIKQMLQGNAKVGSPQSNKLQRLQKESIEEAIAQAQKDRLGGTEYDIGPFYGLPSKVEELFTKHRKIKSLYEWQKECLSLPAIQQRQNLIYSLPTSGGKTLVAEILILRELLCRKKDTMLILPFVSIVQEKVRGLAPFAVDLDFLVEEYAGHKGHMPPKMRQKSNSLYICTMEKANGLVNCLIEMGKLDNIGLVVVDELHMLGEGGSRGAVLEMTLTKLMHASTDCQIIGMSATLNNTSDLTRFLQAELYSNNFRPVELTEYVKLEDNIFTVNADTIIPDEKLRHDRIVSYPYTSKMVKQDPDHLCGLVSEVIPDKSCLVFCSTKKNCENVAVLLCEMMPRHLKGRNRQAREALYRTLKEEGNGQMCPVLRKTVPYGLAYHHSGLTMDERKLIEEAYSEGTLCLLTCTSTLAAGVNLPAKRVILRAPYVGMNFLQRSQYKQMVGRAGRAGIDTSGESIVIVKKKDKEKLLDLISGPYDSCMSSLMYDSAKGVRSLLLTTIGLKLTPTIESVIELMRRTLLDIQSSTLGLDIPDITKDALQSLIDLGMVKQTRTRIDGSDDPLSQITSQSPIITHIEVTRLGKATFKGSVDIQRAPTLFTDLCKAQKSLVVSNHLHLLYLATPYDYRSGQH